NLSSPVPSPVGASLEWGSPMVRLVLLCSLTALLLSSSQALRGGDDEGALLALQKAVQKAIREAEPAIACILVWRSRAYERFGRPPARDSSGHLAAFDAEAARKQVDARPRTDEERDRLAEEVRRLNLADPANVPEAYGSGVVIDERGLILTNYHVVREATK